MRDGWQLIHIRGELRDRNTTTGEMIVAVPAREIPEEMKATIRDYYPNLHGKAFELLQMEAILENVKFTDQEKLQAEQKK